MWDFGFQLLQEIQLTGNGKNGLISPFSIAAVFSMLFAGAKGKTKDEMRSLFGFTEDALAFYAKQREIFRFSPMVQALAANTLWADKNLEICRDYEEKLSLAGGNQLFREDFSLPERLVEKVNAAISSQSKNMIRDLLSPLAINPLTRLLLVNVLYFEAKWQEPFDLENTADADFHLADGTVKKVPFMSDLRCIPYFHDTLHKVHGIFLPYENPDFEFAAMMPSGTKKSADKMLSLLCDNLYRWRESASSEATTDLRLPKLDLAYYDFAMGDALERLGLKTVFSDTADLSGISANGNLQLGQVIHATRLKLTEYSTQAAAATVCLCVEGCLPQFLKKNRFVADYPFAVVLWHRPSNTPLFVGMINDP